MGGWLFPARVVGQTLLQSEPLPPVLRSVETPLHLVSAVPISPGSVVWFEAVRYGRDSARTLGGGLTARSEVTR